MTETLQYPLKKKSITAPLADPSAESPFFEQDYDLVDGQSNSKRRYQKKDRSKAAVDWHPEERTCLECNSSELIRDEVTGDMVCTSCGMVLESHLVFVDKTGISFNSDDDITPASKSKRYSSPISEKISRRLQKAEKWTHTWADIHQIIVKKEINRYIYEMDLPKYLLDNSLNLYQKVYRKNAIQGRGIKAMVAASVYINCRQHSIPVFFQDIERISKQEHSTIRKCFNFIMDNFKIQLPVLDAKQFIPKLIDKLEFSELLEKVALRIIKKLESSSWSEKINNPKHLAAISIFFAYNIMQKANKLNISITQKDFSNIVGMSETTLRKYRRIFQQAITVKY